MRKLIIFSVFVATAALTANAQTTVEGSKFMDNWSMELKAGAITPLTHSAFVKSARPAMGVEFTKQLTPVFGLGFQGMGYVNTTHSKTAIDGSDVSVLGKVNLMNLFGPYLGSPRAFEIEALTGIGWLHSYVNGPGDSNSWSTRFGMNLNFNLGEERAWTLGIKPALVYDMQGDFNTNKSRFNANHASFELTAGIAYHFNGSNGSHHFTLARLYDQAEVNSLNNSINNLRQEVIAKDGRISNDAQRINVLQQEINDCRSEASKVMVVEETNRIPETLISFRQGKSVVDASQQPNVERVATYLIKHPEAKVMIKGYASPEGNIDLNNKLAAARAEAVKTILVNKYRINSDRVKAEGQGVGDMFSEPDWNRVSICTIKDAE